MTKKLSPVEVYTGGLVRSRRQELKMSQMALAQGIGVTFQQVQKYENGANRIGSSRLVQIAHVLKVTPGYFFEGAPGKKEPSAKSPSLDYVKDFVSSKDEAALINAYTKISDKRVRRMVVALVDSLSKGK